MAAIPAAAATPPVSLDAALLVVSLGAPVVVGGVPFVVEGGGEALSMDSAPMPVELAQSVVMKVGSVTNVISAHCLMNVSWVLAEPKKAN